MLEKNVFNGQAARKGIEEECVKLKRLVSASDGLTEKLADSDKSLKAAVVEVAYLR